MYGKTLHWYSAILPPLIAALIEAAEVNENELRIGHEQRKFEKLLSRVQIIGVK